MRHLTGRGSAICALGKKMYELVLQGASQPCFPGFCMSVLQALMALLVFPGGLMALSPQEPLTLPSTRALESCMEHSARGVCPGQRCLTRVNQEEFSVQITCPGLSSLVALCPSAQD